MIKFFSCNKNEPTELSPMDKNRNLRVNLIIIKEKNTWHESFASEDPCHKNNLRQICFQQYVYQQLHVWSFMQMFQVIWVFWESFFTYSYHTKNIFDFQLLWNSIFRYWALPEYMPLYHYFFLTVVVLLLSLLYFDKNCWNRLLYEITAIVDHSQHSLSPWVVFHSC